MFHSQYKSLLGEGVFNADGTPPLLLLAATFLTDVDLYRWNVEVRSTYLCYTYETFNLIWSHKIPPSNVSTIFYSGTC